MGTGIGRAFPWWGVPSFPGRRLHEKELVFCRQPGEPSARLNTGIAVCCRQVSNACLHRSRTLLQGPDPLPKFPCSREGRQKPRQKAEDPPRLKSMEITPKIVTPPRCRLHLTSETWQHSQQIIGVEARSFLILSELLQQKCVLFCYFIVWKRFSAETGSSPDACDMAELILGLLSAKISQPQVEEGEGLCFFPVGWLQGRRAFSGK